MAAMVLRAHHRTSADIQKSVSNIRHPIILELLLHLERLVFPLQREEPLHAATISI